MGRREQKNVGKIIEQQKRMLQQKQAVEQRQNAIRQQKKDIAERKKVRKRRRDSKAAASSSPSSNVMASLGGSSVSDILKRISFTGSNDDDDNTNTKDTALRSFPNNSGNERVGRSVPFTSNDVVLLVGEGNFSFTRALTQLTHRRKSLAKNVVATSLDSRDECVEKYPETVGVLRLLAKRGVRVLHRVDARKLDTNKQLRGIAFTKIVFNFPHEGRGVKDEAESIRRHRTLIRDFFRSAIALILQCGTKRQCEICITVKQGAPYNKWRIADLARNSYPPLMISRTREFNPRSYPGYAHRRTRGGGAAAGGATNDDDDEHTANAADDDSFGRSLNDTFNYDDNNETHDRRRATLYDDDDDDDDDDDAQLSENSFAEDYELHDNEEDDNVVANNNDDNAVYDNNNNENDDDDEGSIPQLIEVPDNYVALQQQTTDDNNDEQQQQEADEEEERQDVVVPLIRRRTTTMDTSKSVTYLFKIKPVVPKDKKGKRKSTANVNNPKRRKFGYKHNDDDDDDD